LVKGDRDPALLENISIEVNSNAGEVLQMANAMVRHPGGTVDTVSLDSFKLQPFDAEFSEYVCHLPNLGSDDVVDVHYVIKSKPTTDIIRWNIQHAYPVKESVFEFLVPEGTVYSDHMTDATYLSEEVALDSTYRLDRIKIPQKGLRLIFKDIPGYIEEPFAPALEETRPEVLLQLSDLLIGDLELFMPNWQAQVTDLAVSEYFGKQYRARAYYNWLSNQAKEIFNTKYTEKLELLKLYEFVHQQFSWDGSYGLIPSHTVQEMASVREVNKASMNMALLALLQEAEFRAHPILVTTSDQAPAYKEIPNINQFNHFVIAVELDREVVYLDAGDPLLPVGFVDSGVRHSNGILIKNYKGSWVDIPNFEASSALLINLEVHKDLSATGTIKASFEGYDAFNERHYLREDPQALYWKERGTAISPNIRIDSVRFDNVKNLLEPFTNTVHFHIEASSDQDELAFHPVFYSFFNQQYLLDSIRTTKVILPSILKEKSIFNISFEEGLKSLSIPKSLRMRLEGTAGSVQYMTSEQGGRIQSTFEVEIGNPEISRDQYSALRIFLREIDQALDDTLVIGR